MPRTSRRQVNRQNQPANTSPEEFITIAITLLDTLMAEMETRLGPMSQRAAKLLYLTPSVYCDEELNSSAVKEAIEMYKDDLPNPDLVDIELLRWKTKWSQVEKPERADSLAKSLKGCDQGQIPNIFVLLQIACTLGVTSGECERSFSTMRRLRTYLWALMNIHYGHNVDYHRAVDLFLKLHSRKLNKNLCVSFLLHYSSIP